MPERPVRWGILATGPMAAAFTEDLAAIPDAEVVAVGSRSERSARLFADRHAIPRAYGGWRELAADPDIDVVYVATPHAQHVAATTACLEGGKAVLCEKPFALNRAQAASMVELAERESLFLMEAMWTYLNPLVRRVCSLIADGVVGEVRSVHADFGARVPYVAGHRLCDPAAGGGALLDLGTYPVSFAHLLLGPPRHVAAWADLGDTGVDESTAMVLGHDTGAMAVLSCSLTAESARGAVVHGTEGRIELPADFYNPRTAIVRRDGQEPRTLVADPQTGHGYVPQAREVMRCLREKLTQSPLVPLRGSLEVMETLDTVRALVGLRFPGE
ncbi:Gfo/Idh/MocA family protein [Streptomyces sp. NPDC054887]